MKDSQKKQSQPAGISKAQLGRRNLVKSLLAGGAALASGAGREMMTWGGPRTMMAKTYDVAVVGAGVFGAWTAYQLRRAGKSVALLDAYGPANSRASSGGESRIIRMGYGPDEIYTRWSIRSLALWKEFFQRVGQPLFHSTGVLWMAREGEKLVSSCLPVFDKLGVRYEKLARAELGRRYPQMAFGSVSWGLLEPESGSLMARRSVQAVVEEAVRSGVDYLEQAAAGPTGKGRIASITTRAGGTIGAGAFIYACGPWLPKVFPEVLGQRIFPTRQEVFFFGVPPGDPRFSPPALPIWIDRADEVYGFPNLESRGLKIALDEHGPYFDADTGSRVVTPEGVRAVRELLARLFPDLKDAPVVETRVCQYENTSNGDFLIDRHPDFENLWLVGGGSGHGFKHGPALGEYVAARVAGNGAAEPRFSLATKDSVQKRAVY